MIVVCRAHTIVSAKIAGLILSGVDEDGNIEWLGRKEQHTAFQLLEENPEYL